jgi:UDP-glucose 4-epimerase
MKVLVTGGTGFLGKHLVKAIVKTNVDKLVLIDNLSNSNLETFNEFVSSNASSTKGSRITFHKVDIQNEDTLFKIFKEEGIDVCIHLAARVNVVDSLRDPDSTFSTNIKGTQNVLSSAQRAGVETFIYASSAAVYGNPRRLPTAEDDPTEPISPYGKSKFYGEKLVQDYSDRFAVTRSLRIFNVYGIGQTSEYAGVITRFAQRISNNLPLIIYDDGNQTRDFVSVDDVTRSFMIAAGICGRDRDNCTVPPLSDNYDQSKTYGMVRSNTFNIGTGVPTSVSALAQLMIKMLARRDYFHEPIYKSRPEGEIQDSQADISKSSRFLGFSYKDDLRLGLARIFSSTRDQGEGMAGTGKRLLL